MENIEDITKSVSISLGETKKIIENYAIRKICEEGYTLEELHKMLHLNLAENPRVYNIYLEVKKENEVLPYQYIRDYIAMYHQIQRIAERNGCTLAQIYKIYVEGELQKEYPLMKLHVR
ncbi:hypothetical protein ACH0F8_000470 [Enterococcus hirae]|nr:hypothetical protein [Enterococcus hirae]EMF0046347.1 hypothetical protein [Enterococcus hirae]EMF0159604.1 hypothetical protein [Enterococcus hirae]